MTDVSENAMFLLPPAAHLCQTCAHEHAPTEPHNAQSLYYQVAFSMTHGRDATWKDALAHCSDEVQAKWRDCLIEMGVDVDAGEVNPSRPRLRSPADSVPRMDPRKRHD